MAPSGTATALVERSRWLAVLTVAITLGWLALEVGERCDARRKQNDALLMR